MECEVKAELRRVWADYRRHDIQHKRKEQHEVMVQARRKHEREHKGGKFNGHVRPKLRHVR